MKTTKFKSTVIKGNDRGTGFIRLPKNLRSSFLDKDQVKVKINSKIEYFTKIRYYSGLGVFVPQDIVLKNNLLEKEVLISFEKIDGFFVKIGLDGRIYVPPNIAKKFNLTNNDLTLIKGNINKINIEKYCFVNFRERKGTKEYMCIFDNNFARKSGIFNIKSKLLKNKFIFSNDVHKEILKKLNFSELNKEKILIFYGNRVPIIVNNNVDIIELSYYLGCYFADGTKKGNSWGICASTFEQAKYYNEMHKKIIKDAKIVFSLSYSDHKNNDKNILKESLTRMWEQDTNINLCGISARIHSTKYDAPNRNEHGTLIFKENRELTRIYYVRLLNFLLNKIKQNGNKEIALDFILGVLEGDGCPGAEKRGHLMIATNLEDSQILESVLNSTKMKFNIRKEEENKYSIHIGSLEVIRNISTLKDKLFKYYPKRRKILKERLAQTGCARFLLGKSKKTSNWLIGQLNVYRILDGKGNLTGFGKKIQKDLKEFVLSRD